VTPKKWPWTKFLPPSDVYALTGTVGGDHGVTFLVRCAIADWVDENDDWTWWWLRMNHVLRPLDWLAVHDWPPEVPRQRRTGR